MEQSNTKNYRSALYTIITVFFFWGFLAASNGIFIPFCKFYFHLTQFESQLIDYTFYGGYFIGSLVLYYASQLFKVDILNKMGYKQAIIVGLVVSALGALLMVLGLNSGSFLFILISYFVIAIGFSLQQTAANPFVIALGSPQTGAHRLNLAGSLNNIGGILGPVIINKLLFGIATNPDIKLVKISSVNMEYYILAGLFLAVALFFYVSKLPVVTSDEKIESSRKANLPLFVILLGFLLIMAADPLTAATGISKSYYVYSALAIILLSLIICIPLSKNNKEGWGAMQYPQLIMGMIAIFTYVGVEVTIQSNLGALLKTAAFGSYAESNMKQFISLYWGSLMIGRWTGAIGAFKLTKLWKNLLTVVVPFVAFGVVLLVNYFTGTDVTTLLPYAISVGILIIGFYIGNQRPARTLALFGILGILAMGVGLVLTGKVALFALISGGLCCSIMWPSIFALAITGLGKYTSQGSAFLIMMILGGSIIPPIQGFFADTSGIHHSYIIPLLGFAYLAFFAWRVSNELKSQGIDVEDIEHADSH